MNDTELDQLLDAWPAPAPPPSLRRGLIASFSYERRRLFGLPVRWLAVSVLAALGLVGAAEVIQNPEMGRFYGAWDSGLYMKTTRLISPPGARLKWILRAGDGYSVGGEGTLHGSSELRVRATPLSIASPRTIYGYEYSLDPAAGGQYQIRFSPLQLAGVARRTAPYLFHGTLAAPPELPASQTVEMGRPIEITLYQDDSSRIYDQIVFQWGAFPEWPPKHAAIARQGIMALVSPQLYIDGRLAQTDGRSAGSGPVLWLHLPGEGRYLIALDPQGNPRFVKAGQASGNTLEFQSEGHTFRVMCAEPIAAGAARPVYVYHQQSFQNLLDPAHPLAAQPFFGNAGPASLHVE